MFKSRRYLPTEEDKRIKKQSEECITAFIVVVVAFMVLIVLWESWLEAFGREPSERMLDMVAGRYKESRKAKSRKRRDEKTEKSIKGKVSSSKPKDKVKASKVTEIQEMDKEQNESGVNENASPKQTKKAGKSRQE